MKFLTIATVSSLVLATMACSSNQPPQPKPPAPLKVEGKTYHPEYGVTVVEPAGPWLGMLSTINPCRPLDAWQNGLRAAQASGYQGSLEDGQLSSQIVHAQAQSLPYGPTPYCRKVAETTFALRYSEAFLQVVMNHAVKVNDAVPPDAFFAWQEAEAACGKADKTCLDTQFRHFFGAD